MRRRSALRQLRHPTPKVSVSSSAGIESNLKFFLVLLL
jgi:hypothetical protein